MLLTEIKVKSLKNKIAIMLFFLALILLFSFISLRVFASSDETSTNNESETIYSEVNCYGNYCEPGGRKLFTFYGVDADCENKTTEQERYRCYFLHSYKEYKCGEISDEADRDNCYDQYKKYPYYYNLGPSGTLIAQRGVWINGWRTYFTGFNSQKEHYLMTGADEAYKSMIFRENSRDAEFLGDFNVFGNLQLTSSSTGIYFNVNPKYGEIKYNENDSGQAVITKNIGTGIEAPKYENSYEKDLSITANYQDLIKIPYDNLNGRGSLEAGSLSIEKGLQLNGFPMKISGSLYFQNRKVLWTELPIDGNYVLYVEK